MRAIRSHCRQFKTITFDNGTEFHDYALLEERFDDAGAGAPSLLRASGDRPHHAGALDSEANYVNAFTGFYGTLKNDEISRRCISLNTRAVVCHRPS